MYRFSYIEYDSLLDNFLENIDFTGCNTALRVRKRLFYYMVNHLNYDYEYLYLMRFNNYRKNRREEIQDVLINHKGICNSIAVVYKLLLEKLNIYSQCVCLKGHMVNLVQNSDLSFSFDDVTKSIMAKDFENNNIFIKSKEFISMIKPKGKIDDYFNYSYEKAIDMGQCIDGFIDKYSNKNVKMLAVPTVDYVYKLIYKKNLDYLEIKKGEIYDYGYLVELPKIENIKQYIE